MKLLSHFAVHFPGTVCLFNTARTIVDHVRGNLLEAVSRRLCREQDMSGLQVITSTCGPTGAVDQNDTIFIWNNNSGGCCLDL
jgi:hypothetical protein